MQRLLLLLMAVVAAILWLRRLLRPAPPAPRRGQMVRDRVCNTYLPRERALRLADAEGEHFFCSEACRAEHRKGSVSHTG